MKIFHIIFPIIFGAFSIFGLSNFQTPNLKLEGRITHASSAADGQFPYLVGIYLQRYNFKPDFCGGAYIGKKFVLTAAHCLKHTSIAIVHLGSTVLPKAEAILVVPETDFIIHESYDPETLKDDIGLIKLPIDVDLSPKVNIVRLPPKSEKIHADYEKEYVTAAGWGKTCDENNITPTHLQWASFQIISNEECFKDFAHLTQSTLCIATGNGVSPCVGDSGGPLVLERDNATLVAVFTGTSPAGCESEYAAAGARITNYLPWIYNHTGIYYD